MAACRHPSLELLPEKRRRVRCRHCDLTMDGDELGDGYCPECFEAFGAKRYDFEEVKAAGAGGARYRCEACGVIVESA